MILAKIRIENNVLTVSDQKRLVSGSKGDTVEVSFGAGWDGLNKHIVLSASEVEVETRNPSGAVEVHCSLMEHSGRFLSVSAYGTDSAGKRVLTTEYVNIGYIYQGTRIMEKCPPVPGWSDGIEADVDRALKTAESVRRDADNGVFDGTDGFSPTANVTETPDGATISITDQAGATSVTIRNGRDGKEQDISGKQNWATIKLPAFPEAATEESLHAWVNANHKGPDRKWLVESSNPDWAQLVSSLGGVPEGVSPDDSAFIILEIPYSEAGPEMLCVQYVLRNKHSVWHQNQYATYSTSSPTWHKSGWYRLDDSAKILEEAKDYADGKVVTIEIEDRGGQDFWTRPVTTAQEINDMVNAGREVRLSFFDSITNTGDQLYVYENTRTGVPYFRRNVITADAISRISWGVQYDGSIVPEEIPYSPAFEKALTIKVDSKLDGVMSIETLRTYFYNLRKTTQRKWQFEVSPGSVNSYLMDILGYPDGTTAEDKAFLYIEIPYSEAGGYEIRYRYQLRDKPGVWDRADYSTLDSKWKTTGWMENGPAAPADIISVQQSTAPVPDDAELVVFEDEEPTPHVLAVPQELTPAQQTQARQNIGALPQYKMAADFKTVTISDPDISEIYVDIPDSVAFAVIGLVNKEEQAGQRTVGIYFSNKQDGSAVQSCINSYYKTNPVYPKGFWATVKPSMGGMEAIMKAPTDNYNQAGIISGVGNNYVWRIRPDYIFRRVYVRQSGGAFPVGSTFKFKIVEVSK